MNPKKIPSQVTRTPTARSRVAGRPQSVAPAPSAGTVATATPVNQATEVAEDTRAPIVEDAIPVRLKPSLPTQPQQAKATVNVLGPAVDVQKQTADVQRQAVDVQRQRPQVTEQPAERTNIVYIGGRPAVQWMDPSGELNFR